METDDLLFAFFPCVRFENQIMLHFRGQANQMKSWSLKKKMEYDINLLDEVNEMYKLVNYLCLICIRKKLRLIIENPFSEEHFLRRYWCLSPSIIDRDRRENGDYYKKPTQYWFLNCKPESNFLFEPITYNAIDVKDAIRMMKKQDYEKIGAKTKKVARSMIHPDYARRFIKTYII